MFAVCRQAYSRNVRASGTLTFGYEGVFKSPGHVFIESVYVLGYDGHL